MSERRSSGEFVPMDVEPTSPGTPATPVIPVEPTSRVEPVTPATPARPEPARPARPARFPIISVGEEGMEPIRRETRRHPEADEEGIQPTRLDFGRNDDFGNSSEDDLEAAFQLFQGMSLEEQTPRCDSDIPEGIKTMRPTISDQVEFFDVIALENKTIRQHLEEVKEDKEIPDKVIFMNQEKNQFVAYDRDNISKLINVEPEQGAISGIFYKCNKMMKGLPRPDDVEYNRPYFNLGNIGYNPGGYVDLLCMIKIAQPAFDIDSPPRVFMVVEPETPIPIDPVANELSIVTHSYQITTIEKTVWFDGKPDDTYTETEHLGNLNSLDMPVDAVGSARCQEGQYSKLVYLVPVKVVPSAEGPVPSAEGSVPSAEEPVPGPEGSVPGAEGSRGGKRKRKRKGKKTLRKKNLLKKKKNKTKRKKSKKNKKSKKIKI